MLIGIDIFKVQIILTFGRLQLNGLVTVNCLKLELSKAMDVTWKFSEG